MGLLYLRLSETYHTDTRAFPEGIDELSPANSRRSSQRVPPNHRYPCLQTARYQNPVNFTFRCGQKQCSGLALLRCIPVPCNFHSLLAKHSNSWRSAARYGLTVTLMNMASWTVVRQAVYCSETSVKIYQPTPRHISHNFNLKLLSWSSSDWETWHFVSCSLNPSHWFLSYSNWISWTLWRQAVPIRLILVSFVQLWHLGIPSVTSFYFSCYCATFQSDD